MYIMRALRRLPVFSHFQFKHHLILFFLRILCYFSELTMAASGFSCTTLLPNTLSAPSYSVDGWFNNPEYVSAGSLGAPVSRFGPTSNLEYPLPEAVNLTNYLFYSSGKSHVGPASSYSALFIFFTQFVFMDLIDVSKPSCPREYVKMSSDGTSKIGVAEGQAGTWMIRGERLASGIDSSGRCLANWAWRRSMAQQAKNWATGYLDGSAIYGTTGQSLRSLRAFHHGKVGSCSADGTSCTVDRQTIAAAFPSTRNSLDFPQNPYSSYIAAIHLMWLNWHNMIADKIIAEANAKQLKPMPDETLFREARRWTIATFQSVVEVELLPLLFDTSQLSGPGKSVSKIEIFDSFAAAAIGFLLFGVPQTVLALNKNGQCMATNKTASNSVRFCQKLRATDGSLDLLMDLISSPAKSLDYTLIDDISKVRSYEGDSFDVTAVAIGRSRDFSLPTYSDMRSFLNFNTKTELTWKDLQGECEGNADCLRYVDRLEQMYGEARFVELLPGGIVNYLKVFAKIMSAQFNNIRQGDIYWYSLNKTTQFSAEQVQCLNKLSLSTIMAAVLNNSNYQPQPNPLIVDDNACWKLVSDYGDRVNDTADSCPVYFLDEPEVVMPVTFTLVGVVVFVVLVIIWLYIPLLIKLWKKRSVPKPKSSVSVAAGGPFFAKEYLGNHHLRRKWRPVLVDVSLKDKAIRLLDPFTSKRILRKISLFDINSEELPSAHEPVRRASKIIRKSAPLRNVVERQRSTITRRSKVSYVLSEAGLVMSLRIPADAHLALKFLDLTTFNGFTDALLSFMSNLNLQFVRNKTNRKALLSGCVTKEQHRKRIEALLRSALLDASDDARPINRDLFTAAAVRGKGDAVPFEDILHMCEMTLPELAALLRTDRDDKFTFHLFNFIDKDRSGAVAYRDLVDFMAQIAKGNDRDRVHLMFQLYDVDGDGQLSFDEFTTMLASLSAVGNQRISDDVLQNLFEEIVQTQEDGETPLMRFEDLWRIFEQHESHLNLRAVTLPGIFPNISAAGSKDHEDIERTHSLGQKPASYHPVDTSRTLEPVIEQTDDAPEGMTQESVARDERAPSIIPRNEKANKSKFLTFARSVVDSYSLELFWGCLYICICFGLFGLRFSESYFGQQPVIAVVGLGAPFARASGLVINFTFGTLILLMARNVFTALRETNLRYYFPFDSLVEAHKFISIINLIATAMHTFAHVANFYYLSHIPLSDLWCLMPELKGVHPPPGRNLFLYLAFETLTGLTGFLLIAVYVPIFAFAFGRSIAFRQFWITHQLWPIAAILLGLHGLGCLLQIPMFYMFFIGPAFIFALDRVLSTLRRYADLRVVASSALPSNVSRLVFEKPSDMQYVAGQYVRIRVPEIGAEYHPFTLTSAPHEANMSLHILTVGPWTKKLHKLVTSPTPNPLSFVQVEGPYGEGHQDWHRSDVAVLVGAGIGVTPFASILKHISHMLSFSYMPYSCKKVYFFWITRNQKQFEWFTDIIREVEEVDTKSFVSTHICITQFPSKFDFRTIMLYICERHFQKMHGHSIFTGLKSITHFGRPNFQLTLRALKEVHPKARSIGVFTCGPSALIPTVEEAVRNNNKYDGPLITHYYETF